MNDEMDGLNDKETVQDVEKLENETNKKMDVDNSDDEDEFIGVRKRSQKKRVLSDSEDEEPVKNDVEKTGNEDKDDEPNVSKESEDYMKLAVTDSEDDETGKEAVNTVPTKSKMKLIDSDSDEEDKEVEESRTKKLKKKREHNNGSRSGSGSGSSSSSSGSSDSEDSRSDNENKEPNQINTKKPKERPPKRMSAKQCDEQMKSIKSFSQKLAREANISIPYHKPKQFTLSEFLNRRNVKKPVELVSELKNQEKKSSASIIKMTPEEIEKYVIEMEDRRQAAIKFFHNTETKDDKIEDTPIKNDLPSQELDEHIEVKEATQPMELESETPKLDEPSDDLVEKPHECNEIEQMERILLDQIDSDERKETEEEVPEKDQTNDSPQGDEYDKLVNESQEFKEISTRPLPLSKRIDYDLISFDRPTVKGDRNMVIDLETGETYQKKPSGPDELLLRFMKHTAKRRQPGVSHHDEKMCVVSTESGRLEVDILTIHATDDEVIDSDARPGAAFVKLKQTLESQLKARKKEEYLKKYQEQKTEEEEDDGDFLEFDAKKLESNDDEMENDQDDVEEEDNDDELPPNRPAKQIMIDEDENVVEIDGDHEAPDLEEDDDCVEDESSSSSESEEEDEPTKIKSGRIIKKFLDSDSDGDISIEKFLQPTPEPTQENLPDKSTTINSLIDKSGDSDNILSSGVESELFDLCSGRFEESQPPSGAASSSLFSQASTYLNDPPIPPANLFSQTQSDNPDMLEMLCSGTFQTQMPPPPLPKSSDFSQMDSEDLANEIDEANTPASIKAKHLLESSDEEDGIKSVEDSVKQKRKRKKRRKFNIDDDENDDDDDDDDANEDDNDELDDEEEEQQEETVEVIRYIDYDSDENEVSHSN